MDLVQLLSKLDRQDKALLLASAIHAATIAARVAEPDKLLASNTFVHRVSGYLRDALRGTEWATDAVIAETIADHFEAMQMDLAEWLRTR